MKKEYVDKPLLEQTKAILEILGGDFCMRQIRWNAIKTTWITQRYIIFFEDHIVVKKEPIYHTAEAEYLHKFAKENMLYLTYKFAICFVGDFPREGNMESVLLHGYRTHQC